MWWLEEGQRQTWPTLALIGWKGGHSHWLLEHIGFWERTFKLKAGKSPSFALTPIGRNNRLWARLRLRPHTLGSQFPQKAGCFPAGMHALPGTSPREATALCSMAHGSWTACTLSPWEQHTEAWAGEFPVEGASPAQLSRVMRQRTTYSERERAAVRRSRLWHKGERDPGVGEMERAWVMEKQ